MFDGECVLCSRGVRFLMRHDGERLDFTASTSPLGAGLYRRFGLDPDGTYLLVEGDRAHAKSDGCLRLCLMLSEQDRARLIG